MRKALAAIVVLMAAMHFVQGAAYGRGHGSHRSSGYRSYSRHSYGYRSYAPRAFHVRPYRYHSYQYHAYQSRSYYGGSMRHARIHRSAEARLQFERMTGFPHGRPGYVIDHIVPLACGGADAPSNMQWQTVADAKAKDKWERKGCSRGHQR